MLEAQRWINSHLINRQSLTYMQNFFRINSLERIYCALSASFIPCAAWFVAHFEIPWAIKENKLTFSDWQNPLCLLVVIPAIIVIAALCYSAPSVAGWAKSWAGSWTKAIGFTVLLEGVLVTLHSPIFHVGALFLLSGINCLVALAKIWDRKKAFSTSKSRPKSGKAAKLARV